MNKVKGLTNKYWKCHNGFNLIICLLIINKYINNNNIIYRHIYTGPCYNIKGHIGPSN